MKPRLTLLTLAGSLFLSSTSAATPGSLVATLERISDCDIITATAANATSLRILFLGVDAPVIPHGRKLASPSGKRHGTTSMT